MVVVVVVWLTIGLLVVKVRALTMALQTVYTRLLADTPPESGSEVPPRYLNEFQAVNEDGNVKKGFDHRFLQHLLLTL